MVPQVASKLLNPHRGSPTHSIPQKLASNPQSMNKEFQARFTALLLGLFTVAAAVLFWINFQKEREFQVPYDGVWWVESGARLVADRVDPDGPGARAGIKRGDQVVAVNKIEVKNTPGVVRQLYQAGVWSKATYSLVRQSVALDTELVLTPTDRSLYDWLRLIALIYLGIGLYVLLRRWTAPGSTHFYIFCLVSFVFYSFHYTGKLNEFDWTVYWGNVAAWLLQPALFLHFVLTFPERRGFVRKHRWSIPLLYVPGLILLASHVLIFQFVKASERLRWNMDRLQMAYLAVFFVAAASVLWYSSRRASKPILRQQLKWVTRGTILAITPFTLFYVIPYLMGWDTVKVSVLSLGLLPLTSGYAIFRYRLMDAALIFKRGMAYTIAAAAVVGMYFTLVAVVGVLVNARVPSSGRVGLILAIAITALLFDPVRKWIQDRLDQFFYRTRYDYRRTLIEFGRELSAETDLDAMLTSVVERLSRTLLVDRLAIFLASGEAAEHQFLLAKSFGMAETGKLDLSFLAAQRPEMEMGHLFFDNTHQVPREARAAQEAISRLDLNYYIPCRSQHITVAVLRPEEPVERF